MKQLLVLTLLPVVLFALEKVNLIKNHSFERDTTLWKINTGTRGYIEGDSAKANAHENEEFYTGSFSASNDTRTMPTGSPPPMFFDSAVAIQGISIGKSIKDLDSLQWWMKIKPGEQGYIYTCAVALTLEINLGETDWQWCLYWIHGPRVNQWGSGPHDKALNFDLPDDISWLEWKRSIYTDWVEIKGISPDAKLDSIALVGYGRFDPGWMGQKVYWDDIRLTGYADYDVGVKEILSGDSVWAGVYYKPVARIKSFGREAADDFLAIAEIWQGETLVWADTIPYTLPGDTEDTLEFDSFPIPNALSYTLTVRTEMSPDESDEDDEMSKTLYGTGIAEKPTTEPLSLEVLFPSTIKYSIPYATHVSLRIYGVTGHLMTTLLDDEVLPGIHTLRWEGCDDINRRCASGVYFVRFEADDYVAAKKMVLLK